MTDEYFDIIDKNNIPTGERRLRSEAHSLGLWHRAVHIYFYRKTPSGIEILVHLRSKTKDLKPNCWDTRFGGHVTAGETVDQTVLSEVREETGLEVDPTGLIRGPIVKRENYPNNEYYYINFYEFNGDTNDMSFKDHEVQEVKWMNTHDIISSMEETPTDWSATSNNFRPIVSMLEKM